MIQVAISTRKRIHRWYEGDRSYGCGAVNFIPRYIPTLDNAEVNEDGELTPESKARLTQGPYLLCRNCFRSAKAAA